MKASMTIARNTGESHPWGFDRLRKEGIEISQALSGTGWTDYNYHDPGVTILEQLCFALTDLIYRAKFDVADYLCDSRGEIDMRSLGLHAPEDVLFCRPNTPLDYQKKLADMSHDINDVRIESDGEFGMAGGYGLYRIRVRANVQFGVPAPSTESLIQQATDNFYQVRNLCEDLDGEVGVVEDIDCRLFAEINIKPGFRAAHILAEIYHVAALELDKGVSYRSYSEGLESGVALDELFDGPHTEHGLIDDSAFSAASQEQDKHLLESAILAKARKVEGVDYISALRLLPVSGAETESEPGRRYRVLIPESGREFQNVRLHCAGRSIALAANEFKAQFEILRYGSRAKAYKLEEDRILSEAPTGTYRDLTRYQSVQNQFPAAYGINRYGVPESDSKERQAQALQLKAYLLLFEQIMSNYLANLGSIRQLFSLRLKEGSTYFKGILQDDEIGSLESVYPENAEQVLDEILAKLDDFIGRKGRLLDYLLALYGEAFHQEHLRGLNYYHSEEELQRAIILNKVRMLNRIKQLSGSRPAAMNPRAVDFLQNARTADGEVDELESGQVSGLQYRSSVLLGFKNLTSRSLVAEVFRHGFDAIGRGDVSAESGAQSTEQTSTRENFVALARKLYTGEDDEGQSDTSDQRYYEIVRSKISAYSLGEGDQLDADLLRGGVVEGNYSYRDGRLLLSINQEKTESSGISEGQGDSLDRSRQSHFELMELSEEHVSEHQRFIRRLMIHLSKECEGMHVLEHILLRPASYSAARPEFKAKYANRIAVFFPAWTARCHDSQFRSVAEEVLRENCPAHIQIDTYWLDFDEMCEFEVHYHRWLDELRSNGRAREKGAYKLDRASRKLLRFMELHGAETGSGLRAKHRHDDVKAQIDERVEQQLRLLKVRRDELELSQRREEDEELIYLRGIEKLEGELQDFDFVPVNHMQLWDSGTDTSDWEFYLQQTSIAIRKPMAMSDSIGQSKHFHSIKAIVEEILAASLGSRTELCFHWLVPEDFNCFQNAFKQAEEGKGIERIQEILQLLKKRSEITNSAQSWQALLGDFS